MTSATRPLDQAPAPEPRAARAGKFLTFFLGAEEYGVEILKVQEIIAALPITRLPRSPSFLRGVINLRGRIIPVVDLRLRLGLPPGEPGERACIIVVRVAGVEMGLLVDRVSEVADVAAEEIAPPPPMSGGVREDFLLGIAHARSVIRLLLDADRVLDRDEIAAVRTATTAHA